MTLVLVAGAWHGAWCWERVATALRASGHRVLTPELPATGTVTLAGWADFVAELVAREDGEIVLAGHSRGGIVISEVAERIPARLRRLAYICGYLLPTGATLADAARADTGSLVAPNMIPAQRGLSCTLRPEVIREAFYGCCSADDAAWAEARLTPEPLKPLVTPLTLTAERFGSVPRAYVECTADRAVTLSAQRAMQAVLPCGPVLTLDTDHSPFLSRPAPLAEWLGRL